MSRFSVTSCSCLKQHYVHYFYLLLSSFSSFGQSVMVSHFMVNSQQDGHNTCQIMCNMPAATLHYSMTTSRSLSELIFKCSILCSTAFRLFTSVTLREHGRNICPDLMSHAEAALHFCYLSKSPLPELLLVFTAVFQWWSVTTWSVHRNMATTCVLLRHTSCTCLKQHF